MAHWIGHRIDATHGDVRMRGRIDPQGNLFRNSPTEERIPAELPLGRIKAQADTVLASMSPAF